jgi:hypothetical protein
MGLVSYSVNKPTYKYVVHLEVCLLAGGLIVELHECVLQGVTRLLVPNHLAVLHLSKPERTSTVLGCQSFVMSETVSPLP